MNLWILTEEKPKISTLLQILSLYSRDFKCNVEYENFAVKIKPIFLGKNFTFTYILECVGVSEIDNVYIKTVSGRTSFLDFLVFRQEDEPLGGCMESLIMAIEETKTSDDESRNTGVYQRGSKFALIRYYDNNVKLYMLYNDELGERADKTPSETSVFGTNILLTLGVSVEGKIVDRRFSPFKSIDEVINFKANMRKPPSGNVPISIAKYRNTICISGRLSKPSDAGNIGHDPNIGALSMIAACIRKLGWEGEIVITKHGVTQEYADKNKANKFFHIANFLDISLDGIYHSNHAELPASYWYYEKRSEKIASILLHVTAEYSDMVEIYHNHAGCERSYFKTENGQLLALPKKDSSGINNLLLPDLVLRNVRSDLILLTEGKRYETLSKGVEELKHYDSIEREYIRPYFPDAKIERWLCIFGGDYDIVPHGQILLYLTVSGNAYINNNAPSCVKEAFKRLMS